MSTLRIAWVVFRHDWRLERRSRLGLNSVLTFSATALFLAVFLMRAQDAEPGAQAGLIWLILTFAALQALPRSFVQEADRRTDWIWFTHAPAEAVFLGKFLHNLVFTWIFAAAAGSAALVLLGLTPEEPLLAATALLLGSAGLVSVSTLLAALVSRTRQRGSLFAVLVLPLLIPGLLLAGRLTLAGFAGALGDTWVNDVAGLVGFAGATLTAGVLLFGHIWEAP